MADRQLVIFNLNGEDFGVEITQVKEIIKPMEIFKVPDTPEFIEGLINLRGKVHTIFNLRRRLGLPVKEFDDGTKIIIVSVNSMLVGFIVDEVNEIVRVGEEHIEGTPEAITSLNKRYLSGVAKIGERIVLLLDLSNVLSFKEQEELKQIVKESQELEYSRG
ncbi:MAG: chemotaxis protein CheW [Clostridiales bacterium]|jgi:purine-binding chemotaxis protein CheW|nr:chemotaxis protein CheW [Eubacteriales bacterium]MDH7565444.1 chemotaxis protein CheW [Clostridiales bacterium]